MVFRPRRFVFAISMMAATAAPAYAVTHHNHTAAHTAPIAQTAPVPTVASSAIAPVSTVGPAKNLGAGFPSFLLPGEVLCFDELDFNAYSKSGKFHTRGSNESCTQLTQLTRVVVLQQAGPKSEIRVVDGALDSHVGWSNGKLPFPAPKP